MYNPINSYSILRALFVHGALVIWLMVTQYIPSCRPREKLVPIDFTIVLPAEAEAEESSEPDSEQPPPKSEPKVEDSSVPEPQKPPPLPEPPKDAVVPVPEKPKPKPKPKPTPKPPPKPEKKPFVKGERVTRKAPTPAKPREDFSKLKPATKAVDRPLTRAEINRALRDGAKPGSQNSVPADESARCLALIRGALYNAWDQPGPGDAGGRPAQVSIKLDGTGRIVSYRIVQSSGNNFYDTTVLKAVANTQPIRGLSLAFLRQYESLTIEFKLE